MALGLGKASASTYFEGGDFLQPVPYPGTFALVGSGVRYGVWRVIGEPGNVAFVGSGYNHRGFTFNALKAGEPWVNLAGISRSNTGLAHGVVPTVVGQSYVLTFAVGNVVDPSGFYGTSSTVKVCENSTYLGSYTNSGGAGTKTLNWQNFAVTFTATDPYTVIALVNGDGPNDWLCGVDNILLSPVVTKTVASHRTNATGAGK